MINNLKDQFTLESISEKKAVDLQLIMLIILLAGIGAVSLFFIPGIGRTISGGTRWFSIAGVRFQPSEFLKITLTLYLSKMFDKKRGMINDFYKTILPALIVILFSSWIIIIQNDFSSSLFLFLLSIVLLFLSGVKKSFLAIIVGFCLLMAVTVVVFQPYRLDRIKSWVDPANDPLRGGYQVLASKRALFQGGFTGKGIGAGDIKLGHLPQAHSDFIFSVVGEEGGIIGITFIIILFTLFFLKGLIIANRQNSNFKMFVAAGFSCAIFFQAMLNMGVVSGLLPPTGIPLPFFSQGGSSIIVTMIMVGFIFNLSRIQEPDSYEE
ncbi:MAG: hypothetical protein B6229_02570 [Spirochaetaceae bacterium 4572_7]|nr:MAG: hypothetical protein B6229_02570 [Spirochaetaceae bacterium 4572_7]